MFRTGGLRQSLPEMWVCARSRTNHVDVDYGAVASHDRASRLKVRAMPAGARAVACREDLWARV